MSQMQILVTGANGFVGSALCAQALARGMAVRGAVRRPCELPVGVKRHVLEGDLDNHSSLRAALAGVNVVVHTAARAHVMRETSSDPLTEFRQVNVQGTLDLARQAAAAGVRRFVFVSSIKVNGEGTELRRPYKASDTPAPKDAYSLSKAEAEHGLRRIATDTGLEITIVRPPLVYGPGVKANFASLMRVVQRGWPVPLGSVTDNRRSLVALDNLVDLLLTSVDHPAAAHQTFLASDGDDLSTAELIRRMGQAMGKPARLLPVPISMLRLAAAALGKRDVAQRLLGSLQVDIDHTRRTLGWSPPVMVDEGLRRTAAGVVQP